jgi:hypothetical protein
MADPEKQPEQPKAAQQKQVIGKFLRNQENLPYGEEPNLRQTDELSCYTSIFLASAVAHVAVLGMLKILIFGI